MAAAGFTDPDPAGPLRVSASLTIPPDELVWTFIRASGPGGQGVNTTDSRVRLRWDVSGSTSLDAAQRTRLLERLDRRLLENGVLAVTASEQRSQWQNRRAARRRLADAVAEALAPPPRARRNTKPTRGSIERRIAGKRRRSELKRMRRDLEG